MLLEGYVNKYLVIEIVLKNGFVVVL